MTTPTTTKKTAAKPVVEDNAAVKSETPVTGDVRISEVVYQNPILVDFFRQYLSVVDEIDGYNKEVLAEKDSEWPTVKILERARELGTPADANVKPDVDIKNALTEWENLVTKVNLAKRKVLELTAKNIGITLTATAERNPEVEAPMKERRSLAVAIGSQLEMMVKMLHDEDLKTAIVDFLKNNDLPAIGRDQVRTFGTDEKATPKYRVTVAVVNKDGEELLSADGFTKAALALTKSTFGYERGKAPKSEDLRNAWEKAGNSGDKTVANPVVFEDNNLTFTITKK